MTDIVTKIWRVVIIAIILMTCVGKSSGSDEVEMPFKFTNGLPLFIKFMEQSILEKVKLPFVSVNMRNGNIERLYQVFSRFGKSILVIDPIGNITTKSQSQYAADDSDEIFFDHFNIAGWISDAQRFQHRGGVPLSTALVRRIYLLMPRYVVTCRFLNDKKCYFIIFILIINDVLLPCFSVKCHFNRVRSRISPTECPSYCIQKNLN